MTKRVYRTAQGKMVDLGALQLRNENVRAVGNMGVNARGDLIDSMNRPIDTRNKQVARQYRKQTNNVVDDKTPQTKNYRKPETKPESVEIPAPPEDFDDDFRKDTAPAVDTSAGGLAAAIARAKEIRQDPLKTQKEMMQSQQGVRKI